MLKVDQLQVSYGQAKVLHSVSLTVDANEMVFLVGRNGAGKTTLLKSIMGLLTPSSGQLRYAGQDITQTEPEELYKQGFRYVAQDKKVFSNLTVRENIEISAYGCGQSLEDAIEQAVEIYPKLRTMLNMKAGNLSGGQRQILLIGQALVGDPKMLLIDEPTQGLASVVINDIVRIFAELRGKLSVLTVEQNLALVQKLADKVYVMKEGRILKEITSKQEISSLEFFTEI